MTENDKITVIRNTISELQKYAQHKIAKKTEYQLKMRQECKHRRVKDARNISVSGTEY